MTDPTEAIRKAHAALPEGWPMDHAQEHDDAGFAEVGSMLDGEFCSVVTVDTDEYFQPEHALPFAQFYAACNPAAIRALLDRLDSAEAEVLEQARLNGMGSEREAALLARLDSAERDQRRYQWLRDQDNEDFTFAVIKNPHFDVYESPEELDAAIDAALRVGAVGGEG